VRSLLLLSPKAPPPAPKRLIPGHGHPHSTNAGRTLINVPLTPKGRRLSSEVSVVSSGGQQRIVITREQLERIMEERNALIALAEGLRQNLTLIVETANELRGAKEVLSMMSKGGMDEVYAEIGGGVFVRASPVINERVLVNVGANYVVEMDIPNAIGFVEARIKEVEEAKSRLEAQFNEVSRRLGEIEQFLLYVATAMRQRQGQGNVR